MAKKQYDKATSVLRKLLKKNPRDDKLKLRLAEALAMSGRNEAAISLYSDLADHYARSGFIHKAIAVNKMILKIDPKMPNALEKLEELYHYQELSFEQKIRNLKKKESKEETQEANQQTPTEELQEVSQQAPVEKTEEIFREESFEEPEEAIQDPSLIEPLEEPQEVFQKPVIEELKQEPPEPAKDIAAQQAPLFSELTKEEFAEVANMMKLREFSPGEEIIREGEPGFSLFVIAEGEVEVVTKDKQGRSISLAKLKDGDFFGEVSLLTGRPRTATIIAQGDVRMIELDKESLDKITLRFPRVLKVLKEFHQKRVNKTVEAMIKSFWASQQGEEEV